MIDAIQRPPVQGYNGACLKKQPTRTQVQRGCRMPMTDRSSTRPARFSWQTVASSSIYWRVVPWRYEYRPDPSGAGSKLGSFAILHLNISCVLTHRSKGARLSPVNHSGSVMVVSCRSSIGNGASPQPNSSRVPRAQNRSSPPEVIWKQPGSPEKHTCRYHRSSSIQPSPSQIVPFACSVSSQQLIQ